MKVTFDDCFQTFPPLKPPSGLDEFWSKAFTRLKRVGVDPRTRLVLSRSLGRESMTEVNFASMGGYRVRGLLSVPRRRGKVPVVISFHDYGEQSEPGQVFSYEGMAHLGIQLRGHEIDGAQGEQRQAEPTHVRDAGLAEIESSFPFLCFLDAIRCLDFVKLQRGVDGNRVGVVGRGFGGAMAAFLAAHMSANVRVLATEQMGFVWHSNWLDNSEGNMAREVRELVSRQTKLYTRARKSLGMLDPLNWVEKIQVPTLASVSLAEPRHAPQSAFGFFNRMTTDKSMSLYPEPEQEPSRTQQRKTSLDFIAQVLNES